MTLTVKQTAAIGREVAAEVSDRIEVVAAVSCDHDSDRLELLVTVAGTRAEPLLRVLNLPRGDREAVRSAMRAQLRAIVQPPPESPD